MRVLVTGAEGFVGTALCETLQQKGYAVSAATRRTVGHISGETDWRGVLRGVEAVVHLANRAHIIRQKGSSSLAVFRRVNVEGTRTLAKQAAAQGVKRFVYVSSISVNGRKTYETPFVETNTPAPSTPYARSKWEAEEALHAIAEETGMEIGILRPPLVYGPRVKANFFALLHWVGRTVPLPLASVHNERHFVAVDNLTDAILHCLEHPAAAGETFLVADNEAISTPELITYLAGLMGKPAWLMPFPVKWLHFAGKIVGREPAIDGLCASLRVDNGKIRDMLTWKPPYTLQQGLAKTVEWYKESNS